MTFRGGKSCREHGAQLLTKKVATSASRATNCNMTRYAIQCSLSNGPFSPWYTIDQIPRASVAIVASTATTTSEVTNVIAGSFRATQAEGSYPALKTPKSI